MKAFLPIAGLLLCLAAPPFAEGQEREVVLPRGVMKQVVSHIVTFYIKSAPRRRSIYVSSDLVKAAWLPTLRNVRFRMVAETPNGYPRSVQFFTNLRKAGRQYSIVYAYGDPDCQARGDVWHFRVVHGTVVSLHRHNRYGSAC
ncbi:MAG TPA: hypothetical protein VGO43_00535 [Pyrinomonadaceae bacterium]|jgi:hypothetical protein|nr:hypothetical protein [Pyrinomonadaceae bacterium]